jgi:hypothetical protein
MSDVARLDVLPRVDAEGEEGSGKREEGCGS